VGKSTWIKNHGLELYTLPADTFRLMIRSPDLGSDGNYSINQGATKYAWPLLLEVLERRMEMGEFPIIDATHIKENDINKYRQLCEKHRYEAIVVDFTAVSIEQILIQNLSRKNSHSYVNPNVIEDLFKVMETQRVPKWVRIVKPEDFREDVIKFPIKDLSGWKKIHHIGDIQSCFSPLSKLLEGGLKEDEFYFFVGDFLDRGLDHPEVLSFFLKIVRYPNVILLEGNHEKHLWNWANGIEAKSQEFNLKTKPSLESVGFDLKSVRKLCQKLNECFIYTYYDKRILVSHAGLPHIPGDYEAVFIPAVTYIKGAGEYPDDIDEAFNKNNKLQLGHYQIHGHRNIQGNPIKNNRSWNLEGKVEFGGYLRSVSLDKVGFTAIEILSPLKEEEESSAIVCDTGLLEVLRKSRFIKERDNGNGISSFNFTRDAFYEGVWNTHTVKARGLFIHTDSREIVSRSYDKFFNVGELSLTTMAALKHNLKFPARAFVKENGFLGIIGYDKRRDELVISSKASSSNEFAKWFSEIVYSTLNVDEIKNVVKGGFSLVFEVIDPKNDPHIIKYKKSCAILLDVIKNESSFSKLSFEESSIISKKIGAEFKRLHKEFNSWDEFELWHQLVTAPGYKVSGKEDIEGFVIEDSRLFMTKIKLEYYSFWKSMRFVKLRHFSGKPIPDQKIPNPEMTRFVEWLCSANHPENERDIVSLREKFYRHIEKRTE
jgi:predicted kinase